MLAERSVIYGLIRHSAVELGAVLAAVMKSWEAEAVRWL